MKNFFCDTFFQKVSMEPVLFYYKHNQKTVGKYDKFGNFYPCKFKHDGKTYKTSEHLYQALKFKNETPAEKEWQEIIRNANTPTIARYLGHQMTHQRWAWQKKYRDLVVQYKTKVRLIENMDSKRVDLMRITLNAKFTEPNNQAFRQLLKETGNKVIGENCRCFWGYYGENNLGKLLMEIREKIEN